MTAYKERLSTIISRDSSFTLTRISAHQIASMFQKFPLSEKEYKDLFLRKERERTVSDDRELNCTTGRLSSVIPQIPSPPPYASGREDVYSLYRKLLPVWNIRNAITDAISSNRVVIINGATGSGKTTQVPQFILEYCSLMKKPCRIICSQPRRVLALNVSERVSAERNESIGQTVGYQIRLESKSVMHHNLEITYNLLTKLKLFS